MAEDMADLLILAPKKASSVAFSLEDLDLDEDHGQAHEPLLPSLDSVREKRKEREQAFSNILKRVCVGTFIFLEWVVVLTLFIAFMQHTSEAPRHTPDSGFQVYMGALTSAIRPFFRLDYFRMPVPRPAHIYGNDGGFMGKLMNMYLKQNSAFEDVFWTPRVNMSVAGSNNTVQPKCEFQGNHSGYQYTAAELNVFHNVIELEYRSQVYIDTMPALSISGGKHLMSRGYSLGTVASGDALTLNNHANIHIFVDNGGRVLCVVMDVWPTKTPCGVHDRSILRPGDTVYWTYRTYVKQLMNTLYEDRWKTFYQPVNNISTKTSWVLFGITLFGVVVLTVCASVRARRVYKHRHGYTRVERRIGGLLVGIDMTEVHITGLQNAKDSDEECGHETTNVNTSAVGGVEMQRMHARSADAHMAAVVSQNAAKERKERNMEWKQYAHEVLGPPQWPTVFAAMVGRGTQLFVAVLLALLLSLGYAREWNNAWQRIAILIIPMTSHISGIVATRYATQFNAVTYIRMTIALVVIPFLFILGLFVIIANVELIHHDAADVVGIIGIACVLLFLDTVHNVCGIWVGRQFGSTEPFMVGSGTARKDERNINCMQRYPTMFGTFMMMTFFTGIPAVLVMHKILRSAWSSDVLSMILLIVCLIIVWACAVAAFSINLTHANIKKGNLRWWWPTFVASGSSSFVVASFAIFLLITDTHFTDAGTIILVLMLVPVVCITIFIVYGAWGVHSSWLFLRYGMYKNRCRSA